MGPFVAHGDCINVDYILCEVELMTFRSIRAGFTRAGTLRSADGTRLSQQQSITEMDQAICAEAAVCKEFIASDLFSEDTENSIPVEDSQCRHRSPGVVRQTIPSIEARSLSRGEARDGSSA